jgi:hypothetical protein
VFRRFLRMLMRVAENREQREQFLAAAHGNATSKRALAARESASSPA